MVFLQSFMCPEIPPLINCIAKSHKIILPRPIALTLQEQLAEHKLRNKYLLLAFVTLLFIMTDTKQDIADPADGKNVQDLTQFVSIIRTKIEDQKKNRLENTEIENSKQCSASQHQCQCSAVVNILRIN